MICLDVQIHHSEGIHARPASTFVKKASQFRSDIYLQSGEAKVNGKSIMGILSLALSPGSNVQIQADGPDAKEAIDSLSEILRHP